MPRKHVAILACAIAFAILIVPRGKAYAVDVAVLGAPSNPAFNADVVNKLSGTGQFTAVDSFLVSTGNPTPALATLQSYDAILVYSDVDYDDNQVLGDILADYVDGGGGVVVGSFSMWVSFGFSLQGRFITENYLPVTTGGQAQGNSMGMVVDIPTHGIVAGVNAFSGGSGSFHNSPITTQAGAAQVAHWTSGEPLVSEWSVSNGTVIALNMFPPSSDARADFWDASTDGDVLMANSLSWAAQGGCPDADGDGFSSSICGGADCDDVDAAIRPGAVESCDAIDQDCDNNLVDEFVDTDGDAEPDCTDLDDDNDGDPDSSDCLPTNPLVYNGALEVCDGLNTDCTGGPDFFELDLDGDGYMPCTGYIDNGAINVFGGDDCDDSDNQLNPGMPEFCDGVDSDCDGSLADEFPDTDGDDEPNCVDTDDDGDGSLDNPDCNDEDVTVYPGAPESCDGLDSDCDGSLVDEFIDTDSDEVPDCVDEDDDNDGDPDLTDCDDTDDTFHAAAVELCDAIDQDCDGSLVDEFLNADGDTEPDCLDIDDDDDGFNDIIDCYPLDATAYPGAVEICDEIDQDCDGDLVEAFPNSDGDDEPDCIDGDTDNDGYDDPVDCAPNDPAIYPTAVEFCDNTDQDCDGSLVDEFDDTDGDELPDCIDPDADGDLFHDGLDCDDLEATTYPGAVESCDDVDSDCDGDLVDEDGDFDGDGMPDCADEDADGDTFPSIVDCDDFAAGTYPGAPEACDNTDADCDGSLVDTFANFDGDNLPDCVDDDADGDGDPAVTDCEDMDPAIFTGAVETCDLIDSDCDGDLVDGFGDADGDGTPDCEDEDADNDGFADALDCLPFDATGYPGAPESCDALDSDCDGDLVDGFDNMDGDTLPDCADTDADGDGFHVPSDCGDLDITIFPGAAELCDSIDTDCDGSLADEFPDQDGDNEPDCIDTDIDGDGDPGATDCDDTNPAFYNGAPESCDSIDSDCDGDLVDGFPDTDSDGDPNCTDLDDDGDFDPDITDCGPLDNSIHFGAFEYCDTIDSDCDGDLVDEFENPDGDTEPSCIDENDDNDSFVDSLDCGPSDATIYPGAPESCDGIDSDCNGTIADHFPDFDNDDLPDCWDPDDDNDGELDVSDCDDNEPTTYTDAPEACDDVDSDCDGDLIDQYSDFDGDGLPDCDDVDADLDGYPVSVDCNDGNPAHYPGALEFCDPFDSDCDGDIIDGYPNADGDTLPNCIDDDDDNDGFDDPFDCGPLNSSIYPGATELCDVTDSNCDGDMVDGFENLDGDALPDCVDADADGDGSWASQDCDDSDPTIFFGAPEACDLVDSDCDGSVADDFLDQDADDIPDCADDDADGDGALNTVDCNDLDKDIWPGAPEDCDEIDSDCDGDLVDGFTNTDGDEKPDCSDWDDDGDGLNDLEEIVLGSDPLNPDSDGDGLDDGFEVGDPLAPRDSDGDHIADLLDPDDDNDGIPTINEGTWDPDGDGLPNYVDLDSDGDGFDDAVEGEGDPDGDGVPNFLDLDSDGNGQADDLEGNDDKDGDGIVDFLDILDDDGPTADPDGDGLLNQHELALGTDPLSEDSDGDGLPDGDEVGPQVATPIDTDGDGLIDAMDLDDDGDGIATADETTEDIDGDGQPDLDVDDDGQLNHLDKDADGDGIEDSSEGDGDFDGDDIPDYLDSDSDDDGIEDVIEGGGDIDGDGIPNSYDDDSDGDGLYDWEEGAGDVDGDGLINSQDVEADGDGHLDEVEGRDDEDGDGVPNWLDPIDDDGPHADPDGDGLTNAEELEWGSDPHSSDSDGDGLEDGTEVHYWGTDPSETDSDSDGLEDGDEVNIHGTDPANYDSDTDGLADGSELTEHGTDPLLHDTDGDGLRDGLEILVDSDPHDPDTDDDGLLDGPDGLGDEDYDGVINVLDPTDDRSGINSGGATDLPEPYSVFSGGATWTNCGASIAARRRDRSLPAGLAWLLASMIGFGLVRRRRQD